MTPAPSPWYADWTQYVCPGPTRRFTPAEMARGGDAPFPVGIGRYIALNAVVLFVALSLALQRGGTAALLVLALVTAASGLAAYGFARTLWDKPTRLRLNLGSLLLLLALGMLAGLATAIAENLGMPKKVGVAVALSASLLAVAVALGWYFLTIYRVQQVEARLRERDEQDARLSLQRRLATAQIHPHFVFNTLASLTHWVESGDARAAPLLKEFNAYLRATLPMFEREQQPLREELNLVRHYLAILQARLGERLQWTLQAEPALAELALPPGSLLTLVENAITHGIEPSLRGGRIAVEVKREGALARLIVSDTGAGLDAPPSEGLGLANTRERLLALHPAARLQLAANEAGGCTATMEIPL